MEEDYIRFKSQLTLRGKEDIYQFKVIPIFINKFILIEYMRDSEPVIIKEFNREELKQFLQSKNIPKTIHDQDIERFLNYKS